MIDTCTYRRFICYYFLYFVDVKRNWKQSWNFREKHKLKLKHGSQPKNSNMHKGKTKKKHEKDSYANYKLSHYTATLTREFLIKVR